MDIKRDKMARSSLPSTIEIDLQRECPVCMENLTAPIYQCCNGHLICGNCVKHVTTCPTCRVEMPTRIRNLQAEKIISALPFACGNTMFGCTDTHEHLLADCEFGSDRYCSAVGISDCLELIRRDGLVTHLMANHDIACKHTSEGEAVEVFFCANNWNDIRDRRLNWKPVLIVQEDHGVFFIITTITPSGNPSGSISGSISWIVYFLGSDLLANDFTAKLKLRSPADKSNGAYLKCKAKIVAFRSEVDPEKPVVFDSSFPQLRPFFGLSPDGENGFVLEVEILNNKAETDSSKAPKKDLYKLYNPGCYTIASSELATHPNVTCDGCSMVPIIGRRYKCIECEDFDFCSSCAAETEHPQHVFLMIHTPKEVGYFGAAYVHLDGNPDWRTSTRGAPPRRPVHTGVTCDDCDMDPIEGLRHKCVTCPDYDLCETCVGKNDHEHSTFLTTLTPTKKLTQAYTELRTNFRFYQTPLRLQAD